NDKLRRAYARERQARFRERQHAFAPFPFSHNSSYNTHHHPQPIPHLHQFNNHDIHRMNHNLYSQANMEMRHNPDNLHKSLPKPTTISRPLTSANSPSSPTEAQFNSPILPTAAQFTHPISPTPAQFIHPFSPTPAQFTLPLSPTPAQFTLLTSPTPAGLILPTSPTIQHQRSHSQPWDFLHTQQSINSTNEWSSSPYFHHEHAHHSQQNHESPHHFRSSSIEQSEHNFLSQIVLDVGEHIDEVNRFRDSRWVAAPEACWRIFSFKLSATYPSVNRLDIHLPDQHRVTFSQDEQLEDVIERGAEAKTMLTGYFERNHIDPNARRLKYAEFPQHYTWHPKTKEWKPRQRGCSIGRIYAVYPSDPERWYLRLLLNHVTGATSFEHLRTFHGRIYDSFRSAALARGLLENDHYLEATMAEADESMMPSYLRKLFGILLATCQPSDPLRLWNFSYRCMTEDWIHQGCQDDALMTNQIIEVINPILLQNGLQRVDLSFPDLPRYDPSVGSNQLNRNWMLDEERASFNVDQVQVN
ncbi:hypothetical protein MJO29_014871, partial [Puccinia striiformis f. sp. tritici]